MLLSDLSTLANVVTTLATMGKKEDTDSSQLPANANGEASTDELANPDTVAKAFDTLAKAIHPSNLSAQQVILLGHWNHM